MVHVILATQRGNQAVKFFPYTGYLGLSPVQIDGVVRTKLDADLKTLLASRVSIRCCCYETRFSLLGSTSNCIVDYNQVLWAPSQEPFEPIGDLELPFSLSIPRKVAGFSSATYTNYKCSWRVEAIVEHAPIAGVGSRIVKHAELPLVRFDLPRSTGRPTPAPPPLLEISHPHLPPMRYTVDFPSSPIGPLDLVGIPIHLLPSAPPGAVTLRSISVIVERRMRFMDQASPPTTPNVHLNASPTTPTPHPSWALQRKASSSSPSSFQENASPLSSTTTIQTPDNTRPGASLLVNPIAAAESSGPFPLSDAGVWSKTLTLQWPANRSQSRWAIGETIESAMVSVKFYARVKLVLSTSHGTESVELKESELIVVSTNDAERQLALSKYDESRYGEGGRSKSKSPRRSHRQTDTAPPLPASASRAEHPHRASPSTSHSPTSPTHRTPRRPHTSAGPRDKMRTGSSKDENDVLRSPDGERVRRKVPRATPPSELPIEKAPLTVATSESGSRSNSSSEPSISDPSDEMREWEAELARIELRSRRSSDLLAKSRTQRLVDGLMSC
ncbi:hypothetical protein MKEN_01181800 [Mycena kentingensis (nom. inval.)]|nr:hypothetical protein MKEN_01181800 [Mycena kentingensis (nom. inval.)]